MVPISEEHGRPDHPPPEMEIRQYVVMLNSFKEGPGVVAKLIACGPAAIEPLRQFLLQGKPSAIYQPRQLAVEALSSLGAGDVLMDYLKQKREVTDPEVKMGEEAVESTAARELVRWPSEEVFPLLLGLARERCLIGAMEALGEFQRPEAIPVLIQALEDDVCRRAAEESLRKIGMPAEPDLIRAAITPALSGIMETPPSLLRRRSALRLLAEIGVSPDHWALLRPLLDQEDGEILTALFRIAVRAAEAMDRELAGRRLLAAIETADWYVKTEMEKALFEFFDVIKSIVEEEIVRRQQKADGKNIFDSVLTALLRVKERAGRSTGKYFRNS